METIKSPFTHRRRRLGAVETTKSPFAHLCPPVSGLNPGSAICDPIPTNDASTGSVPLMFNLEFGAAPAFDPTPSSSSSFNGDLYVGDRLGGSNGKGIVKFKHMGLGNWSDEGEVVLSSSGAFASSLQAMYPATMSTSLRYIPSFVNPFLLVVGTAATCDTAGQTTNTGPLCASGRLFVMKRKQTGDQYTAWSTPVMSAADGNPFANITTHADLGSNGATARYTAAFPTFTDLNGDGQLDLVLGTAGGTLRSFANPNLANDTMPSSWLEMDPNPLAFVTMDNAYGFAMPHAVDLDGDQKDELLVGSREGSGIRLFVQDAWDLSWSERRSGNGNPFSHLNKLYLYSAVPATYDVNGDGFADLVVGDMYGRINVWISEVGFLSDTWAERENAANPFFGLDLGLPDGGQSWPTFADLNGDGHVELIVGGAHGVLRIFWRVPTNQTERAETGLNRKWVADPFCQDYSAIIKNPAAAIAAIEAVRLTVLAIHKNDAASILTIAPTFGDLTGNGKLDLIIGLAHTPVRKGLTPSSLDYPGEGWAHPMLFFENTGTKLPSWVEFEHADLRVAKLREYILASIGTSAGLMSICGGGDFVAGQPCNPHSATSAVITSSRVFLRIPPGGQEALEVHFDTWKDVQKFMIFQSFELNTPGGVWMLKSIGVPPFDAPSPGDNSFANNINNLKAAQRHIAGAVGTIDFINKCAAGSGMSEETVVLIFDHRSDFHTFPLPDGPSLGPNELTKFTDDETPFPASLPYPNPVGAFYDSSHLVVGSTDGKLHSLMPTNVCNLARDGSGAGGGCVHSFAGNCPSPYLDAPLCTCAAGYMGEYCTTCIAGFGFGDDSEMDGCLACTAGKFRAGGSNLTKCLSCPIDTYSGGIATQCLACNAGERTVANQAACEPCASGFHAVKGAHANGDGSTDCVECPATGSTCGKGVLKWDVGMWAAEGDASKATKATNVYKCFTPEACVLSDDAASISCNTKDGYKAKGVLCGECDGDFVRSGRKCATCYENWISTTLTALIGLIVFGIVVYLVVEHSFNAARGALAPVIKKVALSHLQLLGVLGVFKAKGTSTFNTIISKPAEVGGGSLTKLQPISCTIGGEWQAYGGFILNMSMPPVVLSVAALLVLPTWLIIGARQRKRTIEDAPTFGPKYGLPIIVGTMCGHLRRAATEGEKRTWAANFDPRSRFIGVAIFILFGLYPSLVGSVASMLNCVTVNETAVLIADVSIVCWEGTHVVFASLAIVFGVIYALGIPAALGTCLLFRCKKKKRTTATTTTTTTTTMDGVDPSAPPVDGEDDAEREDEDGCCCLKRRSEAEYLETSVRQSFGFLFEGYATDRGVVVAWETLVMGRKLAVALVGAMMSDPYLQILAALLILVVSFGATAYIQPYNSGVLNILDSLGLFVLITTQVLSIVYFYSDSNSASLGYDKLALDGFITALLVLANAIVVLAMVGALLAAVFGCLDCHLRKSRSVYVVTRFARNGGGSGSDELADGWEALPHGDGTYYHKIATGETSWEKPVAAALGTNVDRSTATDTRSSGDSVYLHPTTQCAVATPPAYDAAKGGWVWSIGERGACVVSPDTPIALRPLASMSEAKPGQRVRWMTNATLAFGAESVVPPRHFGGWRPCACGDKDEDEDEDNGDAERDAPEVVKGNPMVQARPLHRGDGGGEVEMVERGAVVV